MKRPVPIRRSLLVNLLTVLALLSVAVAGTMWLSARRAAHKLSAAVIEQALDRAELELQGVFDPVERQLTSLREWVEEGLVRIDDPEIAERMLAGPLRRYPWTRSMLVADDEGQLFLLSKNGSGGWARQSFLETPGGLSTHREQWTDDEPTRRPVEPPAADPRQRPWYRAAIEGEARPTWTEPFELTSGEVAITAATTWEGSDGKGVAGISITLLQISRFTTGLKILDSGGVFVLTEDGRMVGLPHNPERYGDDEAIAGALLERPREMGDRTPEEAFARLSESRRIMSTSGPIWVQVRPFELSPARNLMIGVAVPEADILGELKRWRMWLVVMILVLVALALWRAARLARRYSLPIESLVAESGRMATGDLEPGEPIATDVAEVRQLTEAHDKMRVGLQTLLKLEHDLKLARQIQQKTLPAELPELPGFELEAWNEPADETGGDSYDLIGLRHATTADKVVLTDGEADRALLLLADATGHGIGPALSVTQVRAMLRMAARLSADLEEVARHLNEQLCADLPQEKFITAWLGLLEAATGTLTSFSAGQGPLLHLHAATGECDVLGANAIPMGMFAGAPIRIPEPIQLEPGDIFAVISDGIFEAKNAGEEEFEVDRAVAVLRENRKAPADEILNHIRRSVEEFTDQAPADDDRTIILIKRVT